ncbi:MAG: hypothetical protein F6J86_46105 [Symploca sp. SIO1B1]|nr:hypothetical protein [Symploca sp. SIO2D2]NER47820.1 hypothetical protein [Symploca sp. SIO1A3]NES01058.1 hypothetical protein [Symploca sp. SIO1B1]
MSFNNPPSSLWVRWLFVASASFILFGLFLVVAPTIARQGFSLLIYSSPSRLNTFGTEQIRYVSLAHAVIGGIMVGWGAALLLITRELVAKGNRLGWQLLAISLGSWFIPDTTYSLLSGYWQNAVLNLVFLSIFAIPLWAIHKHFYSNV